MRTLSAALAVVVALGATTLVLGFTDHPWLLASLGGSCVILFGMPGTAMAMPRSLFGGHLIASLIGLAFLHAGHAVLGGPAEAWMIAAVAATLAAMLATDTIHSPAGANPVVIFLERADWWFLAWPLLVGLVLLFAVQVAWGRGVPVRSESHRL